MCVVISVYTIDVLPANVVRKQVIKPSKKHGRVSFLSKLTLNKSKIKLSYRKEHLTGDSTAEV